MAVLKWLLAAPFVILAIFGISASGGEPAIEAPYADTAQEAVAATVQLKFSGTLGLGGHGSGVIIAPGLVLTNAHVAAEFMRDGNDIAVFSDGSTAPAKMIWRTEVENPGVDLALVAVDTGTRLPVKMACSTPPVGAPIAAIGNPLAARWLLSYGTVGSLHSVEIYGEKRAGAYFLASVTAGPGSSGGGIFDADWQLVGLTEASFSRSISPVHVAISASAICKAFARV